MWEASLNGLMGVMRPETFALMMIGIGAGTVVAILPGIGSTALLTMALPFAMGLSPYAAIALLVSIDAISSTGSTITSVLTGIPGSSSSLATIIDGFPMTRKGEGARAVAAGLTVSAMGGIFGAVVLTFSIPFLRPLVLGLGYPEYFMLALWGISMVGVLSGRAPVKGLIAGVFGIFIMMVGLDPKSGTDRWVFDQPYLWDGIDIVLVALGIYGIPEVISMAVGGAGIARKVTYGSGLLQGVKDSFRHWFLVLRSSAIGTWVGFVPGIGGSTAAWLAYGHAVQTCRNKENFGKGDIRGVIAPEASNNGGAGGAYITALAFGIPGSTSTALILVAFLAVGIQPGPSLLTEKVDIVWAVIWTLVLSNVIAAGLCLFLARPISRMAFWPFHMIVPVILVLVLLGAFTANYAFQDLLMLLGFAVLGFFMKLANWPRAPLILGIVLGPIMEKYLWLASARYGTQWLWRPGVILLFVMIAVTVVLVPVWQRRQEKRQKLLADRVAG
ncbi:MAG: tripartite tricarboxylate transporter permease [Chloroflexi bacterium]|nr:tripartite tricarboxylate transporter permease [Chloroflexota bacterium]